MHRTPMKPTRRRWKTHWTMSGTMPLRTLRPLFREFWPRWASLLLHPGLLVSRAGDIDNPDPRSDRLAGGYKSFNDLGLRSRSLERIAPNWTEVTTVWVRVLFEHLLG